MLELKLKYQSIDYGSHVSWLIKCEWAKLSSENLCTLLRGKIVSQVFSYKANKST